MTSRRIKLPIGAGGYFVLTTKTLRFPMDSAIGEQRVVAEMLVNADGNGSIVLVPPGERFGRGVKAVKVDPLEAVELLRRVNLQRLAIGKPEHRIPAALIRRAKAEQLPGFEAVVAFPGQPKTFYEGRGSWDGTGLWVSAGGEYSLEMRAPVGILRKMLSEKEARLWLDANGHQDVETDKKSAPTQEVDQWRIATRGHDAEGSRALWMISWGTGEPVTEQQLEQAKAGRAAAAKEAKLRDAVKRARSISPPTVSPPRKRSKGRRRKA